MNEQEVRAIVEFFTRDSDKEQFCGLGVDATVAQVEERFGGGGYSSPGLAIFDGREVQVTKVTRTGEVVLGERTYTCLIEVLVPAAGFPQVDVRLRREGYVVTELKAAARRLIWIETSGVKKAAERFQLTPRAVLRVQSSRR